MRLSEELRNRTNVTRPPVFDFMLLYQLLERKRKLSATSCFDRGASVAAHAREASRARSDAEFCSKLDSTLQEADESALWLELLRTTAGLQEQLWRTC